LPPFAPLVNYFSPHRAPFCPKTSNVHATSLGQEPEVTRRGFTHGVVARAHGAWTGWRADGWGGAVRWLSAPTLFEQVEVACGVAEVSSFLFNDYSEAVTNRQHVAVGPRVWWWESRLASKSELSRCGLGEEAAHHALGLGAHRQDSIPCGAASRSITDAAGSSSGHRE